MAAFKVGDIVEIIRDEDYSITTIGSYGEIIKVRDQHVVIRFDYIPKGILDTYPISIRDIKLVTKRSREERVLDKVRLIHSRQLKRGIIHV